MVQEEEGPAAWDEEQEPHRRPEKSWQPVEPPEWGISPSRAGLRQRGMYSPITLLNHQGRALKKFCTCLHPCLREMSPSRAELRHQGK